jgi:glycosyltransferase involved in cell wall biosynthesis
VLRFAQSAWRALPHAVRTRIGPKVEFLVRRIVLGDGAGAARHDIAPGPLILSHYGDSAFGIGRAGRLTEAALKTQGLDPILHDIRPALADGRIGRGSLCPEQRGGVWITHCNPEHAAQVMCHIARADWAGRYRIGYWAWELPRAPLFWFWMARFFHEIWAPSAYVAQALSGAPAPVHVLPHPVPLAPVSARKTAPLTVLTLADLRSSLARKNPLGAIEAYRRAFPEPRPDHIRLRVKLNGVAFDAPALTQIKAAANRPDIDLIERVLSNTETEALFVDADLLLSLHRAEGFGLPIAEAMARGAPALATGWSGNTDFMYGLDDLLVRYRLIPVRDASGVYSDTHAQWADPDIDDAVAKLRRLAEDDTLRAHLGAQSRQRIAALHTPWAKDAPWRAHLA